MATTSLFAKTTTPPTTTATLVTSATTKPAPLPLPSADQTIISPTNLRPTDRNVIHPLALWKVKFRDAFKMAREEANCFQYLVNTINRGESSLLSKKLYPFSTQSIDDLLQIIEEWYDDEKIYFFALTEAAAAQSPSRSSAEIKQLVENELFLLGLSQNTSLSPFKKMINNFTAATAFDLLERIGTIKTATDTVRRDVVDHIALAIQTKIATCGGDLASSCASPTTLSIFDNDPTTLNQLQRLDLERMNRIVEVFQSFTTSIHHLDEIRGNLLRYYRASQQFRIATNISSIFPTIRPLAQGSPYNWIKFSYQVTYTSPTTTNIACTNPNNGWVCANATREARCPTCDLNSTNNNNSTINNNSNTIGQNTNQCPHFINVAVAGYFLIVDIQRPWMDLTNFDNLPTNRLTREALTHFGLPSKTDQITTPTPTAPKSEAKNETAGGRATVSGIQHINNNDDDDDIDNQGGLIKPGFMPNYFTTAVIVSNIIVSTVVPPGGNLEYAKEIVTNATRVYFPPTRPNYNITPTPFFSYTAPVGDTLVIAEAPQPQLIGVVNRPMVQSPIVDPAAPAASTATSAPSASAPSASAPLASAPLASAPSASAPSAPTRTAPTAPPATEKPTTTIELTTPAAAAPTPAAPARTAPTTPSSSTKAPRQSSAKTTSTQSPL